MKTYNAKDARKDIELHNGYNRQRHQAIEIIKDAARHGDSAVVLELYLEEADWCWLETLGYTVTRPRIEYLSGDVSQSTSHIIIRYLGTVSW